MSRKTSDAMLAELTLSCYDAASFFDSIGKKYELLVKKYLQHVKNLQKIHEPAHDTQQTNTNSNQARTKAANILRKAPRKQRKKCLATYQNKQNLRKFSVQVNNDILATHVSIEQLEEKIKDHIHRFKEKYYCNCKIATSNANTFKLALQKIHIKYLQEIMYALDAKHTHKTQINTDTSDDLIAKELTDLIIQRILSIEDRDIARFLQSLQFIFADLCTNFAIYKDLYVDMFAMSNIE